MKELEPWEADLLNSHPMQALMEKSSVTLPDDTAESTAQHQESGGESFKLLETTDSMNSMAWRTSWTWPQPEQMNIGSELGGIEGGRCLFLIPEISTDSGEQQRQERGGLPTAEQARLE